MGRRQPRAANYREWMSRPLARGLRQEPKWGRAATTPTIDNLHLTQFTARMLTTDPIMTPMTNTNHGGTAVVHFRHHTVHVVLAIPGILFLADRLLGRRRRVVVDETSWSLRGEGVLRTS